MEQAALVLEGGGMRGIFTGGVLDIMMERGMVFPYVVGVSAGACNALDIVSGQIGRTRDCIAVDDKKLRYVHMDPLHIVRGTAFDMEMLCHEYPFRHFPFDFDTFFASETECEQVVTNCLTGEAEYLQEHEDPMRLMQICSASCSIPLINKEVEVDGVPCLDGGVSDSVPILRAVKKGWKKNVVVLTQKKEYRKKIDRRLDPLIRVKYRKYPQFAAKLIQRNKSYNRMMDLLDKWEEEGRIFVIRPVEPVVGRTEQDPEVLRTFYRQGRTVMEESWEAMQAYLKRQTPAESPDQADAG